DRRASAGALGRHRRARRAGGPRAGPGADPARARLGARPGARRRPRPRPAHPPGAVGRRAAAAALTRAAVARPTARTRALRPAPPPPPARPGPAQLLDATRRPVQVTERGAMPAPPALFGFGSELTAITSWAGPWPVDERWWSDDDARRVVRCQIVDVRGRAYL